MDKKVKKSQCDRIIAYIAENGSATIRELFIYLNINSPSKRLSELRREDKIITVKCSRVNAAGETKYFNRYYLKGANNDD